MEAVNSRAYLRSDPPDYSGVTEVSGDWITGEALAMLHTRYAYAAALCEDCDVLEVGCGSGPGLGVLARRARKVTGGEYTLNLVRRARRHYGRRLPVLQLDAHGLPFREASFDAVVLYEAIYYLSDPGRFLDECHRVLRHNGIVLICTVNREWRDFNPSPLSVRYFSAGELSAMLAEHRFGVELRGAFPVCRATLRDEAVSLLKRTAVNLRLIPGTMRGKRLLKRLFLGPLTPVPAEIGENQAEYRSPQPITDLRSARDFKVLFALGHRL